MFPEDSALMFRVSVSVNSIGELTSLLQITLLVLEIEQPVLCPYIMFSMEV